MADLVFRSTTRGGRDYFEVTDDGMIYGGKDRYTIKTDESQDYADTIDEVLAELVFDGAWRVNYDKIEVDELGIGDEYKEIVKLIRKKYNWLYNLPKGSEGRQFYYDIGRYFKQELKKGTDYNKIFDKIDSIIERSNFTESKIKTAKKSLVRGLDVDFVVDHLLSLEDPDNFDLINELGDLWETYNSSWSKFNKFLSDFWKVMEKIEKLDSFDKTCKEIIEAWYDDIEKIFYSEENPTEIKLNYGFKGNDVFESLEESSIDSYVKLMVNRIVDELIGEYSSREWGALSANEKFDAIKTEFFIFEGKSKYLSEVVDLVIENMNHPFDIVFESKKAIKNKDITEGMYVKNGKDTWKVIYWDDSYKNALLQYIDKNGDKSDNYVIAESYTLEGDYQNPTITWVNGMYFDADSNVGAVNEFKAWSSGKLKKSVKKSITEMFDDEELVGDFIDFLIYECEYDKKTVEKYFYKKYKLNDFDLLSIKDYVKIKNEIEHELGYDNII